MGRVNRVKIVEGLSRAEIVSYECECMSKRTIRVSRRRLLYHITAYVTLWLVGISHSDLFIEAHEESTSSYRKQRGGRTTRCKGKGKAPLLPYLFAPSSAALNEPQKNMNHAHRSKTLSKRLPSTKFTRSA